MNDHDLLLAIQELLDGVVWTPDTTEQIAVMMSKSGYTIRDLADLPYGNQDSTPPPMATRTRKEQAQAIGLLMAGMGALLELLSECRTVLSTMRVVTPESMEAIDKIDVFLSAARDD